MQPHGPCDTGGDAGSHETALTHAAPHPARAVPQAARVDTGDSTQDAGPRRRRSADRAADDVALAGRTNRVDGAGRKRRAESRTHRDSSCPPGRVRVRPLAARAAAGFLVVLAALLALPLQAEAQTEVWSGTLTVRNSSGVLGCSNGVENNFCSVHLSDDDFTHELDPVSWTRSERRIRCPEWDQRRQGDGRDDSSVRSSGSEPFGWSWMRARRSAPSRASWI